MRKNKSKNSKRRPWGDAERQAHADGVRLRAVTIHHKRKPAPSVREWD